MNKIDLFFILISLLTLNSCNKEKKFNFPRGEWVLKEFVVKGSPREGYSCSFKQDKFESLLGNCVLNFDGKKRLTFTSSDSDKLKIIDLKNESENLFFTPNNYYPYYLSEVFSCQNHISLTVRTKKLKKLKFTYSVINDSILIGEFWAKGQAIDRYDAPNFSNGIFELYNTNVKGEKEIGFSAEILGVYHLKK